MDQTNSKAVAANTARAPGVPKSWNRLAVAIVILASLVFAIRGYEDQKVALSGIDFKPVYAASRCMIAHCDPYNPEQTRLQFAAQGGDLSDPIPFQPFYLNYPPNALFLIIPLALLPWSLAYGIWQVIIIGVFVSGVFLITNLCRPFSPLLSSMALSLFVITSLLLVMLAQPAALVIGLLCIATWCFIRKRHLRIGILCFAISLVFKPHVGGFILLYFLLANGTYRKLAGWVLVVATLLSLPGLVRTSLLPESRNWKSELAANISGMAARGRLSDSSPANPQVRDQTDLQAAAGFFRDDRRFDNYCSWILCGLLLCAWGYAVLKMDDGIVKDYLCLAAISSLAMLPLYHRGYDTRLLLLTFPALSLLLSSGRLVGGLALAVNLMVTVMTFTQLVNTHAFQEAHRAVTLYSKDPLINLPFERPIPLACLLSCLFYLGCCYSIMRDDRIRELKRGSIVIVDA